MSVSIQGSTPAGLDHEEIIEGVFAAFVLGDETLTASCLQKNADLDQIR